MQILREQSVQNVEFGGKKVVDLQILSAIVDVDIPHFDCRIQFLTIHVVQI